MLLRSFTITATGVPTPAVSLLGTFPAGVTLTSGTGSARISGTPAANSMGTYTFTATASNGVGSGAIQTFTLTVVNATAPAFTSANNAAFTVGAASSFAVTASGGPPPTLSLTSISPHSVSGVSFNATTGVLSGTPATNTGGIYTLTFAARNGVASNATQTFTLTVNQSAAITTGVPPAFLVSMAFSAH